MKPVRSGLGQDFVAEIAQSVAMIRQQPEAWPQWQGIKTRVPVRKFVLQRFPFALPYLVHEEAIIVLAVAHGRRSPGYWRARLDNLNAT